MQRAHLIDSKQAPPASAHLKVGCPAPLSTSSRYRPASTCNPPSQPRPPCPCPACACTSASAAAPSMSSRQRLQRMAPGTSSRRLVGLALALLAAVSAPRVNSAPNPYCASPALWTARGPGKSSAEWSSWGKVTHFAAGPCLQVSGIGITETQKKTIIVIDRDDLQNTYMRFPGSNRVAYAEELNLNTMQQRPLEIITNTFCSSGQFMPDGTFISVGGANPESGGWSLRALTPCDNGRCQFSIAANMTTLRWYPTSQILPDGRLMVVGGSYTGVDANLDRVNNPTVEYYPRKAREGNYRLQLLVDTLPFNLYPFVHLLPSGRVFIFASDSYILYDTDQNTQVRANTPPIKATDGAGWPIVRSYPLSGTSALFPLSSANGYRAEIMICGGASRRAKTRAGARGDPTMPADNKCYRIFPEDRKPQWVAETMSARRVMPNAVLLPDGTLLILNGGQTGYAGIPNFSHQPALTPELYDTKTHKWYPVSMPASKVPRMYHSSALLLHDATVFVSGGNPNSGVNMLVTEFPTEFRTEFFHPHYLRGVTPKLNQAPATVKLNSEFVIRFQFPAQIQQRQVSVVLAYPGFSTHSANHGMRNVVLDVTALHGQGYYIAHVKAPPNRNVCPPTWYWLFVLVDGRPNRDGHAVFVQ